MFRVARENLRVDRIGLRDGALEPDGTRDLVFDATIQGAFSAVFVVSTSESGEPTYGLRAETLVGSEEVPTELGADIDIGAMTPGIGVIENAAFLNTETGSVRGGEGTHNVTLLVPNAATLHAGSYVRLYVRSPSGALVSSLPIAY